MMVCACRSSEFRRGNVDEILARAGIFQGVQPSAVAALTKQLQPVDFPRGHTVFAEGEPGDRLYIILSGKVKIGRRSPDGRENQIGRASCRESGQVSVEERCVRDEQPNRRETERMEKKQSGRISAKKAAISTV